jgi:hypothetical protein
LPQFKMEKLRGGVRQALTRRAGRAEGMGERHRRQVADIALITRNSAMIAAWLLVML